MRVITFFDGQNLYHSVKKVFGYYYPNYNIQKLSQLICNQNDWRLIESRFYTGIPKNKDNNFWHSFWNLKLGSMRRKKDIFVYSRSLRYIYKNIQYPNGQEEKILVGDEKGIDVRIAIDIIRLAHKNKYDIALIFSQDQDLSEVSEEIREIAREQNRFIKLISCFPKGKNQRGINKTDWFAFDKDFYDQCLDARNYLKKK